MPGQRPSIVVGAIRAIDVAPPVPVEPGAYELEVGGPIFLTEDAMEGPTAFAQKRKPEFKGR